MVRTFLLLVVVGALSLAAADAATDVSFSTLLEEMIDRESVARWPSPGYTCKQASSYDRDSNDPGAAATWYANWDRSQFERIEVRPDGKKEHVLMDVEGPGAVVRFWGTWHGPGGGEFSNGTLRVYLDGGETPAIEGPIRDLLSGGALVGPPLSDFVSKSCPEGNRAHNLYLPIPYAEGCKITYQTDAPIDRGARQGEALYYQINYRSYAPGTRVRTFAPDDLERCRAEIERVQQALAASARPAVDATATVERFTGALAPGESREARLEGPAAIRSLRLRMKADDLVQALRSTVVQIAFDGAETVWCPAGDFFGALYEAGEFKTWYTSAGVDGTLSAHWVMPFGKSAVVRITNLGDAEVGIDVAEVVASDWDWNDRSLHFHANWREYAGYKTHTADMSGRAGPKDANYVTIAGEGVYVGDTLTLFDAADAWWGEGDEKIYVDGESFPSHFGTGTEDYYGYAWCRGERFAMPFHAQPIGVGNLGTGPTINSRFRVLDAIPFRESLRFDMEIWSWANTKLNYAPTSFWYARPGAKSNVKPQPEQARARVVTDVEQLVPVPRVAGALEGEAMEVSARTGGVTETQAVSHFGWSANKQLWWRDAKVGDEITLTFQVEESGAYDITANLTLANDYGVVAMAIDGRTVGEPIDLYATEVKTEALSLGRRRLDAGAHRLSVRLVGANEQALPRRMFGLDYLLLSRDPSAD